MLQDKISNFKLGEIGTTGLATQAGIIEEDLIQDLTFPNSVLVYKEMGYDSSVASAVGTIQDFIENLEWSVDEGEDLDSKYPKGFIQQCMNDMQMDWSDVVREASSIITNGFCVQEKAYKRRSKANSKYDDGLIGWSNLPTRSQDTIAKWLWSKDGRTLTGVQQDIGLIKSSPNRFMNFENKKKNIPRSKFMLHRYKPQKDNPEGYSPLNSAYISWKYKTKIEEYEATGISRDMGGMLLIELPPEYLATDAPEDKKQTVEYFKKVINNYNANQSAGIIFPKYIDPDSKQNMFGIKLQGVEGGGKQYDTQAIIARYEKKILMTFLADVLGLGHDQVGSYALSSDKTNLLAVKIKTFLNYITRVFNEDLIPQTFRLNGWDDTNTPKIVHSDLEEISLDELGKFIQRVASVGAIEIDKALNNGLRQRLPISEDGVGQPLDDALTSDSRSRAGESKGTSGTGAVNSGRDDSTSNTENA